jgi:hypothetical protein
MTNVVRLIACTLILGGVTPAGSAQDEKVDIARLPRKVAQTVEARFPGARITTATKTIGNREVVYDSELTRRGRKHEIDVKEDGAIVSFENEIAVGGPACGRRRGRQRQVPGVQDQGHHGSDGDQGQEGDRGGVRGADRDG